MSLHDRSANMRQVRFSLKLHTDYKLFRRKVCITCDLTHFTFGHAVNWIHARKEITKKMLPFFFFSEAFGNPAHSEIFLELLVPFLMQISVNKLLFTLEWWLQKKKIIIMCVGVCVCVCVAAVPTYVMWLKEMSNTLYLERRRFDDKDREDMIDKICDPGLKFGWMFSVYCEESPCSFCSLYTFISFLKRKKLLCIERVHGCGCRYWNCLDVLVSAPCFFFLFFFFFSFFFFFKIINIHYIKY